MICIYHKNCVDGFSAAMVVKYFFDLQGMEQEIEYYPCSYGENLERLNGESSLDNEEILIVDFSFPQQFMEELSHRCKSITVIDHHKTAQENLIGLPENVNCILDMEKCGTLLTWEHFFGKFRKPPEGILYVNDRDLWLKVFERTDEFHAGVSALSKDMSNPEATKEWETALFRDVEPYLESGRVLYKRKMDQVMADIDTWLIEGECYMTNLGIEDLQDAPFVKISDKSLASDIGSTLCGLGHPYVIMHFWCEDREETSVSLRSSSENLDMSEIAAVFGGGGHKGAAGFWVKERI